MNTTNTGDLPPQVLEWLFKVVNSTYHNPRKTFQDVSETLIGNRFLRPRTRVFTETDGKSSLLLCLYGKVPAAIAVPVHVWVPPEYPIVAPFVLVDLESLGENRLQVSNVLNSNGKVSLRGLKYWEPETSRIATLLQELVYLAQQDALIRPLDTSQEAPILPSRPPSRPPRPSRPNTTTIPVSSSESSRVTSPVATPPLPPKPINRPFSSSSRKSTRPALVSPTLMTPPPAPAAPQPDLIDNFEMQAANPYHERALQKLRDLLEQLAREDARVVHETLETRTQAISVSRDRFQSLYKQEDASVQTLKSSVLTTTQVLSSEIQALDTEIDKAQRYIQEYGPETKIDDMIVPESPVALQLYGLVASDHALTDCIQALGRLFHDEAIDLDVFIKKTRSMARKQFQVRVHIMKVMEHT
ncbi:LAMI_0A05534g1_1 [Lachancea mirantina]|uniref:LAMI_0A05534g1_1 n=1 Tax=Lachancea mirantina TaxID=1230905 RepID=A0A1G4IQB5_9SACH|nr:LAMI_0A05534g1_1 [Lachancea mirantina]